MKFGYPRRFFLPLVLVFTSLSIGQQLDRSIQHGILPDKTGLSSEVGVQKIRGVEWKSTKLFEIDYANNLFTNTRGEAEIASLGFSEPLYFDGLLFFRLYQSPKNQVIAAVDAKNGNFVWLFKSKENLSAPLVTTDAVYFTAEDGRVIALDSNNGKDLWQLLLKGQRLNTISDLTYSEGALYFSSLDGVLNALDIKTRYVKWTFKGKGMLSPPVAGDGLIIFGDEKGMLRALDQSTGKEKWVFDAKKQIRTVSRSGNVVYLRNDDGDLFAVNCSDGTMKWKTRIGGKHAYVFPLQLSIGSPISVGSQTILFSGEEEKTNYLFAINAVDGSLKWKTKLTGPSRRALIAKDLIYVGSLGTFYALDTKDGKIVWSIDAKRNLVSSPAIAGSRLYLISDEGVIYCLY